MGIRVVTGGVSGLTRNVAAAGAVFLAAAGLAACAGGGLPGDAVVQVGETPVTKAAFEHWMGVAAASSAQTAVQETPGKTAPKPVVPDPPAYTACIAHLQATEPQPAKGQPTPATAQLRSQCERQYTALKQQVLGFLISSQWLLGEASEEGVPVSGKEAEKQFNEVRKQEFPKEADYRKFLVSSGQTASDLLLRVKLNLVSRRIQQKIAKGTPVSEAQVTRYYSENKTSFGKQTLAQAKQSIKQRLAAQGQQGALTKFVASFRKKWIARTDCRTGYVVQDCKQFNAPKTPAFAPSKATAPAGTQGTSAPAGTTGK